MSPPGRPQGEFRSAQHEGTTLTKTLIIAEKPSVAQDIVRALTPVAGDMKFDEENTGWGWKTMAKVPMGETDVATTCKLSTAPPRTSGSCRAPSTARRTAPARPFRPRPDPRCRPAQRRPRNGQPFQRLPQCRLGHGVLLL